MFFGRHTAHRIKTALDLHGINQNSSLGRLIFIITKLSTFLIPIYFAYSRFDSFEFTFINILKFIGWFVLAHLIYEGLILTILTMFLIRIKDSDYRD